MIVIAAGYIVPVVNITAAGLTPSIAAGTRIGTGLVMAGNWLLEELTSWWQ